MLFEKFEIEVVQANEEDILRVFDDDLFLERVDSDILAKHQAMVSCCRHITEIDQFVDRALRRGLNLTIPESDTIYTIGRKTNA